MILENYKGVECSLKVTDWGEIKGKIVEVEEDWIKLSTSKNVMVINCKYIEYVKFKDNN